MSNRVCSAIVMVVGILIAATASVSAAVPTRMTVQGKLTNAAGDPVPAGIKSFTFKIYDAAAGGMEVWPAGPGEVQPLSTDADGLWTAEVGAVVALTDPVFSGDTRWLEVTVNDGVNPAETLPRIKLNTSPYTFRSEQSNNAANAGNADNLGGLPPSGYALNVHTHDAATVTDEPGIASRAVSSLIFLPQGATTMQDLVTCTLTIAQAGYIHVQARCGMTAYGTTGANRGFFQVDETAGGSEDPLHYVFVGDPAHVNTGGAYGHSVYVDRIYSKPAGAYVFRLEAVALPSNGSGATTQIDNAVITAAFYPKAYGTVAP